MSQERLERLFDAHHQRLYRLARRLCLDAEEAKDMVQETFLRAARAIRRVPEGAEREEAWLVRVLVNHGRDTRRRLQVRERGVLRSAPPEPAWSSPEAAAVARDRVRKALAGLSARRRAVVVLHFLEELPTEEIARLLGISPVTVRYHLSVGRRRLAFLLANAEGSRVEGESGGKTDEA